MAFIWWVESTACLLCRTGYLTTVLRTNSSNPRMALYSWTVKTDKKVLLWSQRMLSWTSLSLMPVTQPGTTQLSALA